MSKKKEYIKLSYDHSFDFGNCALRALGRALYLEEDNKYFILLIRSVTGMKDIKEGLSFYQIKKILNFLKKQNIITVSYYPNNYRLPYLSLVAANPDRDILAHFDGHLSYTRKGDIIDGYFDEKDIRKKKPTGWWIIGKIEEKKPLPPLSVWRHTSSSTAPYLCDYSMDDIILKHHSQ